MILERKMMVLEIVQNRNSGVLLEEREREREEQQVKKGVNVEKVGSLKKAENGRKL